MLDTNSLLDGLASMELIVRALHLVRQPDDLIV
jgi:hypothetical protein